MKSRLLIFTISGDGDGLDTSKNLYNGEERDGIAQTKNLTKLINAQRSKRVIVVDDDYGIRNMLQTLLKLKGFVVTASLSDGIDLTEVIDELNPKPDAILLDERMPRMSGVDACKIVHGKYPEISIFFVSADDSAKERAKLAGAKAFLKKPVSIEELVRLINST